MDSYEQKKDVTALPGTAYDKNKIAFFLSWNIAIPSWGFTGLCTHGEITFQIFLIITFLMEYYFQYDNSNSNSLLYQTPGVYVQGGSSKQFNSSCDISFGKSLSKVYTGGREQQSKGQS